LILADPPTPVVQVAPAPPVSATAAPLPDTVPPAVAPPAHVRHAPGDPLEKFNRSMFRIHMKLDRAVLRPAAMGYQHAVPRPVRSGIRHFFSNLNEPIVFANFVLQLKPKSAVRTLVRFLINSTVGVGGLVDVAKSKAVELPHQPNSFGDTLGFYGVKPGPYLFLPLMGPSDFRDFAGAQLDGLALPNIVGDPFDDLDYVVTKAVLTGLDLRAESDADLHALLDDALDPYATLRSVYLQDRAGEIAALKGKGATDVSMPGDLQDPAADGVKSAPASASPELQDPLADPAAQPTPSPPKASPTPELQDPLADPAAKPAPRPSPAPDPGAPAQR
jgi:phospholipid-binding lipoprotein MlaA